MKFRKMTAQFDTDNIPLAEEMICHVFFFFNLKGVVCHIPIPEPDEGFGTQTLELPKENAIVGYLPDMDASDLIMDKIQKKLDDLASFDIQVNTRIKIVDEQDWADAWKSYFNVTRITDRIVVKPEWKDHTPAPGEVVIHIDPGMAFGTGTHPTTAMCLEMLDNHLEPGQKVLDVGCGSGILMIAAAKLGAGRLTGIDTDPLAVDITRKNLEKNQIEPSVFTLAATTLDQILVQAYDLVVANIIAQVIVDILEEIEKRMTVNGIAVLSGIIQERRPDILRALEACNLCIVREQNQEEWVAMVVCRKKD
ncbi:MAG: 50S ribosomal protein L11 methyltransferase [Desulfobacter sp.]|nr:MAG: 50S ribosomal protein L11 methyltransferase [Desulfobacter sp.]